MRDELLQEIAKRKHDLVKGMLAEILDCFISEGMNVSEILLALDAVLSARPKPRHPAWSDCSVCLESAAEHAEQAEQAARLEQHFLS